MIDEKLTKELVQELMAIKIEVRGVALKTDAEFVLQKAGKKGLEKIETKMAELGCPIKYKDIKTMDFYPIGLDAASMLVIKEVLGLEEEQIEEIGINAFKLSFLTKIFIKYFSSLRLLVSQVSKMWHKYYSAGDLEISVFSEEKRYIVLKLKNFDIHPIYCVVFRGYFSKITESVVKAPTNCQETECTFRGDKCHEFLVKW